MPVTEVENAVAAGATAEPAAAERVAIVVVHGVADQKAGETAESLVELLVSSALDKARYIAVGARDFVIPVVPIPATLPAKSLDEAPDLPAEDALAVGGDVEGSASGKPSLGKAFVQSLRSDFQRSGKVAEPTIGSIAKATVAGFRRAMQDKEVPAEPARDAAARIPIEPQDDAPSTPKQADRGVQFTQYLLRKANRNGIENDSYAVRRTRLARVTDEDERCVDVYEMYWADLSRLSGAIPRIISELFTLIFRLSRLGRETVDEASRFSNENRKRRRKHWTFLAVMQTAFDWLFVNGLALLFAQLLMIGLLIMAVGLATHYDLAPRLVAAAMIVGGFGTLAYVALASSGRSRSAMTAFAVAVLGSASLWPAIAPWGFGLAVLIAISIAYDVGLRVAADRFPFVQAAGIVLWSFVVGIMVGTMVYATLGDLLAFDAAASPIPFRTAVVDHLVKDTAPHLMQAVLTGFEWTIGAIKVCWILIALPFLLWTMATTIAAFGDNFDERASAGTGRLGLLTSLAVFLLVAMAIWAGLKTPLALSVDRSAYTPSFWARDVAPRSASAPPQCFAGPTEKTVAAGPSEAIGKAVKPPESAAAVFLERRYVNSTETFAMIALLLLIPGAFLFAMFVPSIFAELKWFTFARSANDPEQDARAVAETHRLGRWLTHGYRWLDNFILVCVLLACGTSLAIVAVFLFHDPLVAVWPELDGIEHCIGAVSGRFLEPLVLSAASLFGALWLFGQALSRYLPGVRAPLDAALDVDNYLREFPRQGIPRARIFARYRALLALIKEQEYTRVVIVSHSQGTVISAELLRFLSSESNDLVRSAARGERLEALLGCKARLLTMGCPLRQLYAARFPTMYHWILNSDGRAIGPSAADIGAEVWANAFASGDYVGRWLWSGEAGTRFVYPTTDTVHGHTFGRKLAYDWFECMPPVLPDLHGASEFETCIGYGAHTHYFEPRQLMVATLVDHLVAANSELRPDASS